MQDWSPFPPPPHPLISLWTSDNILKKKTKNYRNIALDIVRHSEYDNPSVL